MRLSSTAAVSPRRTSPLAVTLGDPAGIGPDIALLSWLERDAHQLHPFAVYGDMDALRERARILGLDVPVTEVGHLDEVPQRFWHSLPVVRRTPGTDAAMDPDAGIVDSIESAATAALTGDALALVTNPIAKKSLGAIPLEYPGH